MVRRSPSAAPRRAVLAWIAALAVLMAVTAGLLAIRDHLDTAHVALTFLLVVLVASAAGGRALGLTLAVLAFVLFNYFFIPPYDTLAIENPFDWIVLVVFLVTSIVATHLLNRAQARAEEARQRAIEVERLAMLGEALRQADELKNALIAGVSHDLRTPLTTIKAIAHQLASRGSTEAASIEEEADRLNRFVADLLDLSRLNAGGMPMHLELNSADELIGAVIGHVRPMSGGRDVRVRRDPEGAILFGTFDMVQSVHVLGNLVENALKYAPPSDPVELFVERRGDVLVFGVADRGPGIPTAERDRVFEPFYRAPGTRPDVGGAGLGLAIARRLAEAQHGVVRHDDRPGGGSVFRFEVPAADAPVIEQPV